MAILPFSVYTFSGTLFVTLDNSTDLMGKYSVCAILESQWTGVTIAKATRF